LEMYCSYKIILFATYTPNTGTIQKTTIEYIKQYIQYVKCRGKREAHVIRNTMQAEYV
jgi:hypothetical protein